MTEFQSRISQMTRGYCDLEKTKNIRCKNCIYCKIKVWEVSTCRALPPYYQGDGWDGYRRWPVVNPEEDWCGKFIDRNEEVS